MLLIRYLVISSYHYDLIQCGHDHLWHSLGRASGVQAWLWRVLFITQRTTMEWFLMLLMLFFLCFFCNWCDVDGQLVFLLSAVFAFDV